MREVFFIPPAEDELLTFANKMKTSSALSILAFIDSVVAKIVQHQCLEYARMKKLCVPFKRLSDHF